MKVGIEEIYKEIELNRLNEAQTLIDDLLKENPNDEALYFLQGEIEYKQQHWGKAINSYNKVLELNPDYPEAKSRIEMVHRILSFFNPDMFNP